jgi:hypothetical protein
MSFNPKGQQHQTVGEGRKFESSLARTFVVLVNHRPSICQVFCFVQAIQKKFNSNSILYQKSSMKQLFFVENSDYRIKALTKERIKADSRTVRNDKRNYKFE